MRFIVNGIELNLTSGLIISQGETSAIRAKTLLVLKYLINHKESIVTKQALLSTIWHDVVVQEQVLVQSIKEIRQLLGSDVIKTYPRQGYQWVAELSEVGQQDQVDKNTLLTAFIITIFCILFAVVSGYFYLNQSNNESAQNVGFKVAFLPVENDMPDDIHDWVPLEGMQYLNNTLQQHHGLSVVNNPLLYSALEFSNKQQQIANMQVELALDLLVQTRLLGYPQDFQLHYNFYLKHNIERGILFAKSVEQCFEQLAELINQRFGNENKMVSGDSSPATRDFGNEAFARGIELYLKREYLAAMPFFQSALQVNPQLLVARRYMAASSVNNGEFQTGISLMLENIEQAQAENNRREAIRSYLMIGALLINWPAGELSQSENLIRAQQYIETAKVLAEQAGDVIFTAYCYEELGKIKRLQGQYRQAIHLFKQALMSHEQVKSNYSQTSALIELARVSAAQENYSKAQKYFKQATSIAEQNGVATNKVAILLAQADVAQTQGLANKSNEYANQALEIANQANNKLLISRVTARLNNHPYYEIN